MARKISVANEEVAISAFGAVTPLGNNWENIADCLWQGKSGIHKIHKFNCESFMTQHAGIPETYNESGLNNRRRQSAEVLYTRHAARDLSAHPQFPGNCYAESEIACIIGVDEPAVDIPLCLRMKADPKFRQQKLSLLEKLLKHFRLQDCLGLEPSSLLANIHEFIPFSGLTATHVGLCSASLQAIGLGFQAIQSGNVEAAIVGGVSGKVNPINLARLELMDVISTDTLLAPTERSRPFDAQRSGFVLAEGAVLFLLEKKSNIEARNDRPLLGIMGYGSSLAAETIVTPHHTSLEMKLAMHRALRDADIDPEKIDLINAHGTSTVLNDLHEAEAIKTLFLSNRRLLVTANKSLHGHMIAAAGAMEVLNTLISANEGFIPGVINLEHQDERCDIQLLHKSQRQSCEFILKNSFGMGGLAASVVTRNYYAA